MVLVGGGLVLRIVVFEVIIALYLYLRIEMWIELFYSFYSLCLFFFGCFNMFFIEVFIFVLGFI